MIIPIALLALLAAPGCNNTGAGDKLQISGTIGNAANMQVYLDQVGLGPNSANLVKAKADANGNGEFSISMQESVPAGIYRLRVGEQQIALVLDGSEEEINVKADLASLNRFQYELGGSTSSLVYRNAMQQLVNRTMDVEGLRSFVDTVSNPLTAVFVSMQAIGMNTNLMDIYQKAEKRLSEQYPGNSYLGEFQSFVALVQRNAAAPTGGGNGYQFIDAAQRQVAPDIKLPNPSGKEYALSELKGKVVLLDFWASWCRPCRMENPNVVKIYNKYKNQGFTVFSVSLDGVDSRQMAALQNDANKIQEVLGMQKKLWKDAIEKDGLIWEYHVSDLKKWECAPANLYGVNSIPRTFMIDKEGKIAAVNLRGAEQIEETLQKLL
jgi:thiol-disulfide isomerase/thioredoxin